MKIGKQNGIAKEKSGVDDEAALLGAVFSQSYPS
jgi:hypothetical protein